MGVTLDLRMIDHQHVVQQGIGAVNEALAAGDTSPLVEYILGLPFSPDQDTVRYRQSRLDRLRELNAPAVIVQNEQRLLQLVTGEAYSREVLSKQSLDELRQLLGTWGWTWSSFSLDRAWYELDWFLQPAEGRGDLLLYPLRPKVGDPSQSIIDQALSGCQLSPLDRSGAPIIRTCGSLDEECFGYNPPAKVTEIAAMLSTVNSSTWDSLVPRRIALYGKAMPELDDDSRLDIVSRELDAARRAFDLLLRAYNTADERGSGMACEYSL